MSGSTAPVAAPAASDPRRAAAAAARRTGLVLLLAALLVPLVPLLLWAITGTWRFPDVLPSSVSARPLLTVAEDPVVREGLANSLVVATTVAVVAAAIGTAAGRAIGLHRFRGRTLVRFLLLSPVVVPPLAAVLGIQVVFVRLGLTGTLTGVVLVHLVPAIPYVTLVMGSVFAGYDTDLEDQARTLGASPVQVLRTVTLPTVAPGLVVAGLFAFLISWGEYLLTLVIGGGRVQTLPLVLFALLRGPDDALAAAVAVVFVVPVVLLLALTSRSLSSGAAAVGAGRP